jgi:hypothetical protein
MKIEGFSRDGLWHSKQNIHSSMCFVPLKQRHTKVVFFGRSDVVKRSENIYCIFSILVVFEAEFRF